MDGGSWQDQQQQQQPLQQQQTPAPTAPAPKPKWQDAFRLEKGVWRRIKKEDAPAAPEVEAPKEEAPKVDEKWQGQGQWWEEEAPKAEEKEWQWQQWEPADAADNADGAAAAAVGADPPGDAPWARSTSGWWRQKHLADSSDGGSLRETKRAARAAAHQARRRAAGPGMAPAQMHSVWTGAPSGSTAAGQECSNCVFRHRALKCGKKMCRACCLSGGTPCAWHAALDREIADFGAAAAEAAQQGAGAGASSSSGA